MCVLCIPGTSTKYNNGQCNLKPWPLHARGNKKLGVIQSQSGFRRAKSLTSARNQTMIPQSPSPLPSHYTNYNTLTPCYKRKTSTSQNDKSFNVTNNSTQIYINLKTNVCMNPWQVIVCSCQWLQIQTSTHAGKLTYFGVHFIVQFRVTRKYKIYAYLSVSRRCTCVWFTAYSDKYVKHPPNIRPHHVWRTVGSGSKLQYSMQ